MTTWNWDDPLARMPEETLRALQAFHDYEAMGPGRSLPLLSKGYRNELPEDHALWPFFQKYRSTADKPGEKAPTRNPGTVEGWSSRFCWQARIARLMEIRKEQREAERLARQMVLEDRDWEDGAALRDRVMEFVEVLPKFKHRSVEEKTGPDGETVTVITVELNTNFAQLAQGLKAASELQRHAVQEPDSTVELRGGSLLNALIKELDELITGAEATTSSDTDNGAATGTGTVPADES